MPHIARTATGRNSALQFHPLADIFPLMAGEEFAALVADIKAHGLIEAIHTYDGMILDGRNRYRACIAAGVKPRTCSLAGSSYSSFDPVAFVISANIHRRHLTPAQKHDLITKLLKADPSKSDRQIGEMIKADHKTVGAVRARKEATGEVSPVEKRVGRDGKTRKQPARKKTPTKRAELHRALREQRQDDAMALARELAVEPDAPPATRKRWADMTTIEQMHVMVPRIAKALAKTDPECASWLHVILMEKDPAVLQELEVALARRLGLDEDEIPAAAPLAGNDPGPIPDFLRRSAP
jgi:ParB-like chromosome segregation protein Spo0J